MKIQSNLFDNASGSLGNITAANGLGGVYFKAKPNPTNPNTANQRVIRNALAAAVVAWGTMTETVRAQWAVYGATCSRRNQTGHTVRLNGWNAFSRAYVAMTQAEISTVPLLTARPANDGYRANAVVTLSKDTDDGVLAIQNTSGSPEQYIAYVGTTTRNTINNYGGSFNYNVDGVLADNAVLKTTKAVTDGRNWVKLQSVTTDGQMSTGTVIYLEQ